MSPYIPWDISYLDKFLVHIKSNIASATNTGILIFAVVFGIGIITLIIRRFTRG